MRSAERVTGASTQSVGSGGHFRNPFPRSTCRDRKSKGVSHTEPSPSIHTRFD